MLSVTAKPIQLVNLLLLYTSLLMGSSVQAAQLRISTPPIERSAPTSIYYSKLLQLALSKTEISDGPFEVVQYPHLLTKARFEAELKRQGVVDIIWATTNANLETEFLPIRISLLKNLNSYRVFLIRKEEQDKFTQIKKLDDLRNFKAGQGSHWSDTDVLLANDLAVVTAPQFEPLFNMLIGKRFDYFPRGLDEVWGEEKLYADKGISIEQHIMLQYRASKYFFVHKNNTALANRLERGLKIAQSDGSFDALFNSIPGYKRGYEEIANQKRLVFKLKPAKQHSK